MFDNKLYKNLLFYWLKVNEMSIKINIMGLIYSKIKLGTLVLSTVCISKLYKFT